MRARIARNNRQARATKCDSGTSPREDRQQSCHAVRDQGWLVNTDRVEYREEIRRLSLQRWSLVTTERIGQPRASRLEEHQPAEARHAPKNAGITGHLPHQLQVDKRLGQEHHIRRPISHDLERNVSTIVDPRVLSLRKLAHVRRVCRNRRTRARAARTSPYTPGFAVTD